MDDPLDPLREIEGLLETSRETQEDHLDEHTGSRIKKVSVFLLIVREFIKI